MEKKLTNSSNINNNNNDFPMSTPPPASLTTSSSSSADNLNQLDNLSNLIINNNYQRQQQQQQYTYLTADEHDNALLDKYEYDMSKLIQENYLTDKDQASQKLFQSFQTSACAVTQMFKDNTTTAAASTTTNAECTDDSNKPKTQSPQLTQWQSFQNSAGAITVLYKDSLEACKTHYDLGLVVGQHRKLKELMTWIKKKKRRTIRKEELINFLIGNISNETTNFNDNNTNTNNNNNTVNSNINSNNSLNKSLSTSSNSSFNSMNTQNNTSSMLFNAFSSSNTTAPLQHNNPFLNNPFNSSKRMHNSVTNTVTLQHTQPLFGSSGTVGLGLSHGLAPSRLASNLNTSNITNNINSTNNTISTPIVPNASFPSNDTNSDLATFREALIMHNRSRDAPPNHLLTTNSQHHNSNTHPNNHHTNQNFHSHHHHNSHHHIQNHHTHHPNHQNIPQPGSVGSALNCDDLDCFFCEQIATHIEHKRSAANSNMNFDMGESPTRKRGRFV